MTRASHLFSIFACDQPVRALHEIPAWVLCFLWPSFNSSTLRCLGGAILVLRSNPRKKRSGSRSQSLNLMNTIKLINYEMPRKFKILCEVFSAGIKWKLNLLFRTMKIL